MPMMATAHPRGDKRFKLLDATMKRNQHQPDALIEVLHKAQELFGCLEVDVLGYVARALRLPPSRVYGVATFYHLFTLKPQGEHACTICLGTACFVKGAGDLIFHTERHLEFTTTHNAGNRGNFGNSSNTNPKNVAPLSNASHQ